MTDTAAPIATAGSGPTNPDAGVIATRPATRPVANPSAVGFLKATHSRMTQVSPATAAAVWVTTKAETASPLEATAEPALNPNQPNHSRAAPTRVIGRLCGLVSSELSIFLLPSMIARTRAE